MSLAKGTLLIGWAVVVAMGLTRIAGLEAQVKQAQAEIAGLRQEVLEARNISAGKARAECDQARARVRMLQAEATGLLNKLLLSLNELPQPAHPTLGPPVWVNPDRPRAYGSPHRTRNRQFRCGQQAALVSFINVAVLARNAGEELLAPRARARRNAPILPARRHVSPQHSKPVMMNELRA